VRKVLATTTLALLGQYAVLSSAGFAATHVPPKIPLCAGLTIVGAVSEPQGDYEPIVKIDAVTDDSIDLIFSTDRADNGGTRHVKVLRTVLREDLERAHLMVYWFNTAAAKTIAGSTAIGPSITVLRSLKETGAAELALVDRGNSALPADRRANPNIYDNSVRFALRRLGDAPVTLPVTVNGALMDLPVIHARGEHMGDTAEFYFLDDESNPITLKSRLTSMGWPRPAESQTVKIAHRCAESVAAPSRASRLEQALLRTGRVDVYDIYFDFNSARIREESKPTLDEIAELLRKHADWTLDIAGHTDSIGSDTANLDLSRRRAASVKSTLVRDHGIPANQLSTGGYGEAQPKDRNDTPEGRARNRRVELVRTTQRPET
jgi:outer membrane protein OmpA-like peptidoglycan-associated protein